MSISATVKDMAWSISDEDWFGDCRSLEELIDYHGIDAFEVGQIVYCGDIAPCRDTGWIDADDLIEMIGERAYDEAGEAAEDFPNVSKEAKQELADFLDRWQRTNCKPTFYSVEKVRTHAITEADLAAKATTP